MYTTVCPLGQTLLVPEGPGEDSAFFSTSETDAAVASFMEHGFAIVRDVIPRSLCRRVLERLDQDVKPYKGLLPRIGGKEEGNIFNESGFLANTLSNVQNSRTVPKTMKGYLAATLDVLTHKNLIQFHSAIFKSEIGLVTWNHFEGNPVTIPHHDSFFWFQDVKIGEVVGAWVALEDIHPGAGRLYVYPGSHRMELRDFAASSGRANGDFKVAEASYRNLVVDFLKSSGLECKAPSLSAGDVLFWDSRTVHGSLVTSEPTHSRASFTAHYCSMNGRVPIHDCQRKKKVNGVTVSFPRLWDKEAVKAKFPKVYNLARSVLR